MNINWYPGHMTKTKRALAEKVGMIDIVIEVLDARAPKSSLNPDFEKMFATKEKLYVLNKSDLAADSITADWKRHFEADGIKCVIYSATGGNHRALLAAIEETADVLREKYIARGRNKTIRALICGIPNVGKSAMINRLAGSRKQQEGNKPGVTRALSWVKLNSYLELLDSPGMLWPKIDDERSGAAIALIGSIRQEILDDEEMAYYLLSFLRETAPEKLSERYSLSDTTKDPWDIMADICKSRGFLKKGGDFDYDRGTRTLLDEFRNGKIGKISLEKP